MRGSRIRFQTSAHICDLSLASTHPVYLVFVVFGVGLRVEMRALDTTWFSSQDVDEYGNLGRMNNRLVRSDRGT